LTDQYNISVSQDKLDDKTSVGLLNWELICDNLSGKYATGIVKSAIKFMWEEDPIYQEASYRFLLATIFVFYIGGFLISLCVGDWELYLSFLSILVAVVIVLCIYAAIVWTIGNLVKTGWKFFKQIKPKSPNLDNPKTNQTTK
jgi:hypothetical protein